MNPFSQLLTQSSGSQVAPETLEMLGRQASQLFQAQGIPLNDAVSQVVANHPELGNEHMQRIIEFANTVTFQEMFQNSEDKNVHFDVADPGTILRDVKDGGSPAHDGKPLSGMGDYSKMPQKPQQDGLNQAFDAQFLGGSSGGDDQQMKTANIKNLGEFAHSARKNARTMGNVAALGGAAYAGARGAKRLIDGKEKTAADIREELSVNHELHANPIDDAFDAHQRLQASRDKLATSYESMNSLLKEAQKNLYEEVKAQVLDPDGAGLGGVIAVLEKVAEADILEALMEPITNQLVQDGIRAEILNTSLKKTAGVVVNLDHPILAIADSIVKVAGEMVNCSKALDDLDEMIKQTSALFKQAGALTNGVRDAVAHKGAVPAGIRQRFPRS